MTPISVASEVGCKRGRGAPGKTPFVAAVEGFRLTEIAAWAQHHLGTGTRVVSDRLVLLSWRHRGGCIHEPVVVGSARTAVERPECRWVNTILGNIKNALRGTYHAIRPKYVQRYLSEFSTVSIVASTYLTSSRDLSTWRSGRRRCRNGYSGYA